jgi:hypothetical protein
MPSEVLAHLRMGKVFCLRAAANFSPTKSEWVANVGSSVTMVPVRRGRTPPPRRVRSNAPYYKPPSSVKWSMPCVLAITVTPFSVTVKPRLRSKSWS